jgi:hypothetical protein
MKREKQSYAELKERMISEILDSSYIEGPSSYSRS